MKVHVRITRLRFHLCKYGLIHHPTPCLFFRCECPHDHCHYNYNPLTADCSEDEAERIQDKTQHFGWCYQGNCGPRNWATLDKNCDGRRQSPIDIVVMHNRRYSTEPAPLSFEGYDEVNRDTLTWLLFLCWPFQIQFHRIWNAEKNIHHRKNDIITHNKHVPKSVELNSNFLP